MNIKVTSIEEWGFGSYLATVNCDGIQYTYPIANVQPEDILDGLFDEMQRKSNERIQLQNITARVNTLYATRLIQEAKETK
jgi:hypothetical protein